MCVSLPSISFHHSLLYSIVLVLVYMGLWGSGHEQKELADWVYQKNDKMTKS
jgi:hypothetical protein